MRSNIIIYWKRAVVENVGNGYIRHHSKTVLRVNKAVTRTRGALVNNKLVYWPSIQKYRETCVFNVFGLRDSVTIFRIFPR